MPIPSTPLVVQLTKQIEKEISAFSEQLNLKYTAATQETLEILTEKFHEHFQTDAITLSMSEPDWRGQVKINLQIGDKFILRRLRDINSDEYAKVTCWMRMKGFEVPPLDDGPLPYAASTPDFKVYGAEAVNPMEAMANKILQAEGERQRFLRSHGFMSDRLTETTPKAQESPAVKVFSSDAPTAYESDTPKPTKVGGITVFDAKTPPPLRYFVTEEPPVSKSSQSTSWMKTF